MFDVSGGGVDSITEIMFLRRAAVMIFFAKGSAATVDRLDKVLGEALDAEGSAKDGTSGYWRTSRWRTPPRAHHCLDAERFHVVWQPTARG